MASSSSRRSGSSGPSKRGRPVYISTSARDRSRASTEPTAVSRAGALDRDRPARDHKPKPKPEAPPRSGDGVAKAKKTERERRLSDQRRKTQIRVVAITLGVVAIIAAAVGIYRSPLFSISRVEVVGTERMTSAEVVRLAAVPADATLIRFPADRVTVNVEKDPRVESVSVSRVFPDAMRIRVVERHAIAAVDAGTTTWLIDSHGFVIAEGSGTPTGSVPATLAPVPLIRDVKGLDLKAGRKTTSEPLLNAVAVLNGISPELLAQVKAVSAPEIDATTLFTTDKVEIVFGSATDVVKKDAIARKILADQRGKVVSIDVRTTDRPTWRGLGK